MDKSSIIKSARGQEEEKVGFSLKLPKNLKNQLQALSEKESVSMNALIVATLQSMINDKCGKDLKLAKNILIPYRESLLEENHQLNLHGISNEELESRYESNQSSINNINQLLGV